MHRPEIQLFQGADSLSGNLDIQIVVADMTPVAANAWVKVEEAKRDSIAIPSKQHTYRTGIVVVAIVALPLECLLGIPITAVLASIGVLAGVWATIEVVRIIRNK